MNSWLLMTPEEIACAYFNNNTLYRKQKSYYKKKQNKIMLGRFEEAESIVEKTKGKND